MNFKKDQWVSIKAILVTLVLVFSLTNCSFLSPVKTEPTTLYMLNTQPQPMTKKPQRRISLLVTRMAADPLYNTMQIVYTTQPHQVGYFAFHRWAETPPQMLQSLIVQTLEKTHYFYVVSQSLSAEHYDYLLNTRLVKLEQVFTDHSSYVHLIIKAQLVNAGNNQVISTKQFSAIEQAPLQSPYGGVIAANRAANRVLNQLAVFCLKK